MNSVGTILKGIAAKLTTSEQLTKVFHVPNPDFPKLTKTIYS